MTPNQRVACAALVLGLSLAHAQDTTDGFSWKMGPVDLTAGQTAKVVFANPFCSNPLLKIDVTLAITDLAGNYVQVRGTGTQTTPAKKHAIVSCNESIQLEVTGDSVTQTGTVVGVLQVIPDLNGIPWTPVNVPLASLQLGPTHSTVNRGRGDVVGSFQPYIVIIPVEPVRRVILQ